MSAIFQQIDLSESEIQRELEGLSAVFDDLKDDEGESWIR